MSDTTHQSQSAKEIIQSLGIKKIRLPIKKDKGRPSKAESELNLQLLKDFADDLIEIQSGLDFHMGARDWCYALEPYGMPKGSFDWGQKRIDKARLLGYLPPGFILEEEGHKVTSFYDGETSPADFVEWEYESWQTADQTFKDSWQRYEDKSFWKGKKYYIQILVEKIGLKSLFQNICEQYRIPIANMRGWGSIEQKADMAIRFKRMEESGHIPVLFVFADFDPPGLYISKLLKTEEGKEEEKGEEGDFNALEKFSGWNPKNLKVDRIGLNYDFIEANHLTWIKGLGTSGKSKDGKPRDLSDPNHSFYKRNTYDIRGYIKKYGKRKCEANAIVVAPELGRKILVDAIERYLGKRVYEKYEAEIETRRKEVKELIEQRLNGDA